MTTVFKYYLDKKGFGPTDLAKLVGVTPAAVSAWISGRSKPRIKVAKKIRKFCDAPLTIWGYSEEV